MGLMQREKGKRFEREIAGILRERWPSAIVRRASQAERADNPDVFVEGGPPLLGRLWLELQDARKPTPEAKLEQAERDSSAWFMRREERERRLPIVIWHRLGERSTWATMRLTTLLRLYLGPSFMPFASAHPIAMELGALLELVARPEAA